ncbi:MAG: hypothetical protein L0287_31185 [Anaerolineae bacterium]|nr:hypothetical protein [Anaerolineae bacterium]
MYTNHSFHLLIVVALLIVTACSPQSEPPVLPTFTSTIEPTLAPAATSTIEPTAAVQSTKTATAIPVYLPFQAGKYLHPNDPTSYFLFKEDGRWAHYGGGTLANSGTYRVEGDLYFQLTNSVLGCPSTSFKYTFDGKFLKFQLTEESKNDTCGDRKDFYNNKTYVLAP